MHHHTWCFSLGLGSQSQELTLLRKLLINRAISPAVFIEFWLGPTGRIGIFPEIFFPQYKPQNNCPPFQ